MVAEFVIQSETAPQISEALNVGYSVVAEFVIQSETAPQISEALNVLLQWNPTRKPKFFMTDYCDAEMSAIEVFPECKTSLCDSQRAVLGEVGER